VLATNTLAQGDTREVGLDQITANGVTIRQAVKSAPWPSRSAALEYSAVWTSRAPLSEDAERTLDGAAVTLGIVSSLDPASRSIGRARRLMANAGISFQGSNILGLGFTMEPERAQTLIRKDPGNARVLFPYLNGQDLNSSLDCSASRWVINFHNWSEKKAKEFSDCYAQLYLHVKPVRLKVTFSKNARDYWWQYERRRPELYTAIAGLNRVIVITLVSKTVMPVMVSTGQVYSHKLAVLVTDDTAMLALLSSAPHYWWTISRSSTMRNDINYSPSDVLETFPMPELTPEMRGLGHRLDSFRREVMLARQTGLTKTYNLVHDPRCTDADIAELRNVHSRIDHAVARAYGWDDLNLDHGFHETRQGIRYTAGRVARQEILDRLLELNHERYAAEVARGLHSRKARRRDSGGQDDLFS